MNKEARPDHQVLQRLIVRLLHDPVFARDVYRDPETYLAPTGLSAEAQGWLLDVDERRWRLDPERAHRSLEGALVHCPVSSALFVSVCAEARIKGVTSIEPGAVELLRFFQSARFHRCIDERGHLTDALVYWIDERLDTLSREFTSREALTRAVELTRALLKLELALIEQRRLDLPRVQTQLIESLASSFDPTQALEPLKGVTLSLPLTRRLVSTRAGSVDLYLELFQVTRTVTEREGQAALLRPRFDLETLTQRDLIAPTTDHEVALLTRTAEGAALEALSSGLARIMQRADSGCLTDDIIEILYDAEVPRDEAYTLLSGWIKEGLIALDLERSH